MSKVIESLKQIQADAHALYIKIHNYHWNVKGMDFFPVHSHTEEIYNSMSVLYDDTAERILQLGEKPYLTIKQLDSATKVETETNDSFNSKEIVLAIIKEYNYLLNEFKHLSKVASENSDKTTETFADDKISKFEKDVWLMSNMIS